MGLSDCTSRCGAMAHDRGVRQFAYRGHRIGRNMLHSYSLTSADPPMRATFTERNMSRRGWVVTLAGMGMNLALGILYAWSVFSKQLAEPLARGGFGWTKTQATLPYTLAIACFALTMIPAGRLQDRPGPRVIASAGGVLTGAGL